MEVYKNAKSLYILAILFEYHFAFQEYVDYFKISKDSLDDITKLHLVLKSSYFSHDDLKA